MKNNLLLIILISQILSFAQDEKADKILENLSNENKIL